MRYSGFPRTFCLTGPWRQSLASFRLRRSKMGDSGEVPDRVRSFGSCNNSTVPTAVGGDLIESFTSDIQDRNNERYVLLPFEDPWFLGRAVEFSDGHGCSRNGLIVHPV